MKRELLLTGTAILIFAALATAAAEYSYGPLFISERQLLETSDEFVYYSLDSEIDKGVQGEMFHHFWVLGKAKITDVQEKQKLIDALYRGMEDGNEQFGIAACHLPYHAIHAVKRRRTLDLTICFFCHNVVIRNIGRERTESINPAVRPIFDEILRRHKLPLSQQPTNRLPNE